MPPVYMSDFANKLTPFPKPTTDSEEEAYTTYLLQQIMMLKNSAIANMEITDTKYKRHIKELEKKAVYPTAMYHFEPG